MKHKIKNSEISISMLGKGLESLMPQGGNKGEPRKAPPPMDLPVGDAPEIILASDSFLKEPVNSPAPRLEPPKIKNEDKTKPKDSDYIFYLEVDKIAPNPEQPR